MSCPSMIIQQFYSNMHGFDYSIPYSITSVQGISIVATLEIIFDVLHVPRVSHPDYPCCPHLWTVSKDELLSLFCKTPSPWGDRQNTPCSGFANGPRYLNRVMTFVLHPLSPRNSITEPRTRFLLTLIKDLTIDFPSHFILSLINVYRDMATRDKLIFPSAITRIIHHSSVKVAMDRDGNSSSPFYSIHPRTSSSMAQLKRMDTRLDTLSNELCQVNTRVGHITWQQAIIGGFTASPSPSP